jgi:hypothetical protein
VAIVDKYDFDESLLKSIAIDISCDPAFSSSKSDSKFAIADILVIADLAYVVVVAEEYTGLNFSLLYRSSLISCRLVLVGIVDIAVAGFTLIQVQCHCSFSLSVRPTS